MTTQPPSNHKEINTMPGPTQTTTTPALWDGFDPTADNALARAWSDLWSTLTAMWTPLADLRSEIATRNGIEPKTVDNMIRTARSRSLIQRQGGYSHKTGRDTRMVRRHPKTQEATAP